ncbi:MAG TPA: hypothetical protein VGI60_14580 [Chthoniobacterales bacterium]|jgi:hypothetical protein
MFTGLINYLSAQWAALKWIWQAVWNFCVASWTWIVATIVGFIAIQQHVCDFVVSAVAQAADAVGVLSVTGLDPNSHVGTAGSWLTITNTFFPLSEALTLVSAWSVVMLAGMTYRFVKSWIPTVS